MTRRALPISLLALLAFPAPLALHACQSAPMRVAWRTGSTQPRAATDATIWVSYQIAIEQVDGQLASLRAPERCVYYRVDAPPGLHDLTLRLHYAGPLQTVRSEHAATLQVRLEAGKEYRLLDLAAGTRGPRKFSPWLQPGAPPEGRVNPAANKASAAKR